MTGRTSTILLASLPALALAGAAMAAAPPTDNPVATFYSGPEGYPAWTDRLHWANVVDMSKYADGKTAFEKFERARDALAAQGGGVLYYPAGSYDFQDMPADGPHGRGLMLKRGVVIRGEAPKGHPLASGAGSLELPTTFIFGFRKANGGEAPRDWNLIGLCPDKGQGVKDVNDVGLCWVHCLGAAVYFGPQMTWGKTWASAGSYRSKEAQGDWTERVPDGTFPMDPFMGGDTQYVGAGEGRLVFGCVLRDAAPTNRYRAGAGHMERFASRLGVYGSRVLVANNALPKSTRNFLYHGVMFDYGNTCGVDVNKFLLGWARDGGKCPGYFAEGVVVRDNWVYNHGHWGYNLSGGWMTIANNHNERDYLQSGDDVYGLGGGWKLTLDGVHASGGASDNLSRAFDLAGRNVWVDGNTFNNTGSNPGNDGEGILCQLSGGTHLYSWAITRNRYDRQRGQSSYIGGWNVDCLGLFIGWNDIPSGWVGTAVFPKDKVADWAIVGNRAASVIPNPNTKPGRMGDTMAGKTYPLFTAPTGRLTPPADVKAAPCQTDGVMVTWTDTCDCEVAFRVERSLNGGKSWTTVAYRPPHIEGHAENPQAWADFTCPIGKPAVYRVVPVGGNDTNEGASMVTEPVTLGKL